MFFSQSPERRQVLRAEPEQNFKEAEKYLLSEKIFSYDELPTTFSVGSLESSINEVYDATNNHPERYEHGFWIHRQSTQPSRLLVPLQLSEGGHDTLDGEKVDRVKPEQYRFAKIEPLAMVHSHPGNGFFSRSDLFLVVGENQDPAPKLSFVSARVCNYLMVRTTESPELMYYTIKNADDLWRTMYYYDYQEYEQKLMKMCDYDEALYQEVCNIFFEDGLALFYNFLQSGIRMAYNSYVGVYYSMKDGSYHQLTEENMPDFMNYLLELAKEYLLSRK